MLSPYSILPLLGALYFAVLGIYAFVNNPKAAVNRSYAYWCFFTSFWQTSWTILFNTQNPTLAETVVRIGYSGIAFLLASYYHFVVNFLNARKSERKILWIFYVVGVLFAYLAWTSNYYVAGFYHHAWGYYPRAGLPGHPIFLIAVTVAILRGPLLIYRKLRDPSINGMRRNQLQYVLVALLVYNLAATDFLVNYGVDFYPLGIIAILLANGLITYAIMKYRLMNVTIFFRRAGLLASVYGVLLAAIIPILFVVHAKIIAHPQSSLHLFIFSFLAMACVVSAGPFLYAHVVRHRLYFKEQTIAGLTHELKGPLAIIENALEILTDRIKTKTDLHDITYLTMIEENQARLKKSIDSLLQAYQTPGRNTLDLLTLDINEIASEVTEHYKPLAALKNIYLDCDATDDTLLIHGDREKISQILSNIVSNAIKFTRNGSIKIKSLHREDSVEIAVEDTGVGITSNELPNIFDRFYQGRRKNIQGSGIGLTIAKAWVEAHGGKIWAESEGEGKGATVAFTLPVST